jgi:hypothetical protein
MDQKRAIAALGALAQETRLALFRLLVTCGPAGLPAGVMRSASAFNRRHCRFIWRSSSMPA